MMDLMVEPSHLQDLDPSTQGGFAVLYEREVPVELRSADGSDEPSEVGALEPLRVKLLIKGPQDSPESLRIELTSESNLFFQYVHDMDAGAYATLQEGQRLMVGFTEYPTVLLRMLNSCIKDPHAYLAVFVMKVNGTARLDFIQNLHYKFLELLSCNFTVSDEEAIRQSVTYRYGITKSRLALMQARLADMTALVKAKNPSLLLQLQRPPPSA